MSQGSTANLNAGGALDKATPTQVFYVLMETPCPYLAGRRERKLLTEIGGTESVARYNSLSRAGFRRSHNFAYRPACSNCTACSRVCR